MVEEDNAITTVQLVGIYTVTFESIRPSTFMGKKRNGCQKALLKFNITII